MIHPHDPISQNADSLAPRRGAIPGVRLASTGIVLAAVLALGGCFLLPTSGSASTEQGSSSAPETLTVDESEVEPVENAAQEETCDWDSARITGPAQAPASQDGDLAEVIVGAWQHTHTDDGSGFEEVTNDHRFVFPSPDRMLYCQHVPGVTEFAENAADVVLNGTTIELPGGKYGYTVTAWDENTMVWDNPVGGGYVYLLQRR